MCACARCVGGGGWGGGGGEMQISAWINDFCVPN